MESLTRLALSAIAAADPARPVERLHAVILVPVLDPTGAEENLGSLVVPQMLAAAFRRMITCKSLSLGALDIHVAAHMAARSRGKLATELVFV